MSVNVYVRKRLGEGKSLIKPDDFIKWAKQDIKGGGRRSIANALTNAKRAIHARIDEILFSLRVQYANDWSSSQKTSEKLKAIKSINIPVTSIVDVLTKRRNDLEHSYFLPLLEQVRADVEAADLWLEKHRGHNQESIVLVGLPVNSIGSSASAKTKTSTFNVTFAKTQKVKFFWDAKKRIITLLPNGNTSEKDYADFKWKELIRIQKREYLTKDSKFVVPSISVATRLYKAYEKFVLGTRGPSFKMTTKW